MCEHFKYDEELKFQTYKIKAFEVFYETGDLVSDFSIQIAVWQMIRG